MIENDQADIYIYIYTTYVFSTISSLSIKS